jgi:hypothetical protein
MKGDGRWNTMTDGWCLLLLQRRVQYVMPGEVYVRVSRGVMAGGWCAYSAPCLLPRRAHDGRREDVSLAPGQEIVAAAYGASATARSWLTNLFLHGKGKGSRKKISIGPKFVLPSELWGAVGDVQFFHLP